MFSRKDLRRLLVPLMIEQALAMTIGMADTVMVASCSEAAVSGVSLIDSVNAVFLWLFPALATGGGVVLAQYIGHGEEENARRSVGQLTLLLVGFSLVVSLLFLLLRDQLLVLLFGQIEPQVMDYARTYFTVSIFSYPFLALYNVGASVFRAGGGHYGPAAAAPRLHGGAAFPGRPALPEIHVPAHPAYRHPQRAGKRCV